MREIKFRAWDGEKMNTDNFLLSPDKAEVLTMNTFPFTVENWELMQFTGLTDKNGKDIYDGDILEWKQLNTWHRNKVYWLGSGFYADTSSFQDDLNEPITINLISALDCEVIGDIYQNQELLNK